MNAKEMREYTDKKLIELDNVIDALARNVFSKILLDIKEYASFGRKEFYTIGGVGNYCSPEYPGDINNKILNKALALLKEDGYDITIGYQGYQFDPCKPIYINSFNITW